MDKARLIAARVLHDLAAPVGAATMALSLLDEHPGDPQAQGIAGESLRKMSAVLAMLRMAFAVEAPPSWRALYPVIAAWSQARGLALEGPDGHTAGMDRWTAVLPALLLTAVEFWPGAARLVLEGQPHRLDLAVEGDRLVSPGLQDLLLKLTRGDSGVPDAAGIHRLVLVDQLQRNRMEFQGQSTPGGGRLVVVCSGAGVSWPAGGRP